SDSDSGRRSASRASLSSEAQANELRGRARRRLIGALALVLAAVIVVPMLFDSSEPQDNAPSPVVVPAIVPPAVDNNVALAPTSPEPTAPDAVTPAPDTTTQDPASDSLEPTTEQPAPATPTEEPRESAPEPEPAETTKPEPPAQPEKPKP